MHMRSLTVLERSNITCAPASRRPVAKRRIAHAPLRVQGHGGRRALIQLCLQLSL